MATSDERTALLAVTCPHCGSSPGEECVVPHARARAAEGGRRRRRVLPGPSTLEAGCHDARWQRALGRGAPVRVDALAAVAGRPLVRQPVGARPW